MNNISQIICSCGGKVQEQETTNQEDKQYGCHSKGCCVKAWKCDGCNTRWTFALEAPEPDWND